MSGNPYAHYDHQGVPGGASAAAYEQPKPAGKGGAMQSLNKWGKQAENVAGNLWGHVRTSNSFSDAAIGRITHGTKLLRGGGFEGVYKQTFGPFVPGESLKKTYACHLSTSNGAVSGTLYITNHKFAFCSDRELTYYPTPGLQSSSFYKVIVPLEKVREVREVPNAKRPTERYIQVVTKDGHEFWYMGFVNHDKGLKNMGEAVRFAQSQNNLSGGYVPGGSAPPHGDSASDRPGYPPAANPTPSQPPPLGYPPAMKPGYGPPVS